MNDTPSRRHYRRVAFHKGARLTLDGHDMPCEVIDLSLKGALIALEQDTANPGQAPCRLHLQLDDAQEAEIVMQARVAHDEGHTLGITWESIDLDSLTQLRRLLELNMGSGEAIERELAVMLDEHGRS